MCTARVYAHGDIDIHAHVCTHMYVDTHISTEKLKR